MINSKPVAIIFAVAALSFALGIFVHPAVSIIRDVACNFECKAQLLYKNAVFFEVRGAVSATKKNFPTKVTFDYSKYTTKYLHENGIELLVVLDSGEFVLMSHLDNLAMLAKPTFDDGRLIWRCRFFGEAQQALPERACSY